MQRIKKIMFVILSIILGLILIFNLYNFISLKVLHKSLATINGYASLEVVSGSMEPTIKKGDMIIINTKNKDIKVNDIITYKGNEGEFVTHRIIDINDADIITKGDNNNTEDKPINKSAIVGIYVTKINNMGAILSSLKSPFTLIMIFVIGVLICFLLSTDNDGNPILDSDEKEFQKFLQEKENKEEIIKEVKPKAKLKKETSKEKPVVKEPTKNSSSKVNTTKKVETNLKASTTSNKVAKKTTNVIKAKKIIDSEEAPKKTAKASTKTVVKKTTTSASKPKTTAKKGTKTEVKPKETVKASTKTVVKKTTSTKPKNSTKVNTTKSTSKKISTNKNKTTNKQ